MYLIVTSCSFIGKSVYLRYIISPRNVGQTAPCNHESISHLVIVEHIKRVDGLKLNSILPNVTPRFSINETGK